MVQLNKRAYAEFDNMVQLKRYYGSTKTPHEEEGEDNVRRQNENLTEASLP
jgi:hypothetical protein